MMRILTTCLAASIALPALAQDDAASRVAERDLREFKQLIPGTYSNEEQVYFQDNLKKPESQHVPRLTLGIEPDGDGFRATTLNPETGRTTEARIEYRVVDGAIRSVERREGQPDCERIFTRIYEQFRGVAVNPTRTCGGTVVADAHGMMFGDPARPLELRRARSFTCWISPQKEDGGYGFYNDLALHDQGGRIWVDAKDGHPRVGVKIRNVRWPAGNNRDSLVLYAYRGEDADTAVSYAWTSPDADRIAINLRWMQASCTRGDDTITPSINLKTGSGR